MASVRLKTGAVRIFERLYILNNFNRVKKLSYCTENNETDKKLSGFAASFIEQSKIKDDEQKPREPESFATLLRNSKFIDVSFYNDYKYLLCKLFGHL